MYCKLINSFRHTTAKYKYWLKAIFGAYNANKTYCTVQCTFSFLHHSLDKKQAENFLLWNINQFTLNLLWVFLIKTFLMDCFTVAYLLKHCLLLFTIADSKSSAMFLHKSEVTHNCHSFFWLLLVFFLFFLIFWYYNDSFHTGMLISTHAAKYCSPWWRRLLMSHTTKICIWVSVKMEIYIISPSTTW